MSKDKIKINVNKERLVQNFSELVKIDSVSFEERSMADALKALFSELGIELYEDDAASKIGGNAGNLYGYWPGELPGAPLLFSAHMDTVTPGKGKQAVLGEDGRITGAGDTVLGADDLSGITAIIEAVRTIEEKHIPHRDIEFLFPAAEEAYIRGSRVFDYTKVRSKQAYVLDLSGSVGSASLQEPTLISFQVLIKGKAAHAGFAPQDGIHAIAVAAEAITEIEQGKIGKKTTVNIGKISGGQATNIVPELVTLEGEIRSYSHKKALKQLEIIEKKFKETAAGYKAEAEVNYEINLQAYEVDPEETVVKSFCSVCDGLGIEKQLTKTFGGSDNNSFLQHGIKGIVLACGMNQVHSTKEYTTAEELERCAQIVAGLMTCPEEK
ncbi:MAG: M20/M25/M40 family metallo-hydrolase [Lachnospiraceae bacterium]|nr:M20/M25/M40 family metallo-hydrolase [Lachnospiraceae bacterium]